MKPVIPEIDLTGTEYDIRTWKHEEILRTPGIKMKWICAVKDCKCYTKILKFDADDGYYRYAIALKHWIGMHNFYLCGKHNKEYKKLRPDQWEEFHKTQLRQPVFEERF